MTRNRGCARRVASMRRGVAMLLVLISMMTATILTVAYLASRDNSGIIGENVARSAAARWAAESGLEVGAAILQTRTDWRNSHTSGKLVDDLALSGGTVDIDVLDIGTGMPPTDSTENVQMTSTAIVDGVQQVSTAVAWVPPATTAVDIDLSEFAIFGSDRVTLAGDATVMRWPMAPLTKLGAPVTLGTQSASSSTITISNNATVIDGRVYSPPSPSGSLVNSGNDTVLGVTALKDVMPMPKPPAAGVSDPPLISLAPTLNLAGGTTSQTVDRRVSDATLSSGAVRTLQGNVTLVSDTDLNLGSNAKLIIAGNVSVVVFDDLIMQNASIELKPGASLKLYVGDQVGLTDSYIGNSRVNSTRDNTGQASYLDPELINIYRLPSKTTNTDWVLGGNSVVKGSVYGKDVRFRVLSTSALYGRVAATEVEVTDQGALFYDAMLDSRSGYTETTSALFNPDATLKTAFKTVASLDTSTLQTLADLVGLNVKSPYDRNAMYWSATLEEDTPIAVGPTQPTPRPVHISWQMTSYGNDMASWETADAGDDDDDDDDMPTLDAVAIAPD
jgi:hypothetical protein